eukprot:453610_1
MAIRLFARNVPGLRRVASTTMKLQPVRLVTTSSQSAILEKQRAKRPKVHGLPIYAMPEVALVHVTAGRVAGTGLGLGFYGCAMFHLINGAPAFESMILTLHSHTALLFLLKSAIAVPLLAHSSFGLRHILQETKFTHTVVPEFMEKSGRILGGASIALGLALGMYKVSN